MEIIIDQEKCIGAGQCVFAAPDIFDQREEDGIVELLQSTPTAGQEAGVRDAVVLCPAAAISLGK